MILIHITGKNNKGYRYDAPTAVKGLNNLLVYLTKGADGKHHLNGIAKTIYPLVGNDVELVKTCLVVTNALLNKDQQLLFRLIEGDASQAFNYLSACDRLLMEQNAKKELFGTGSGIRLNEGQYERLATVRKNIHDQDTTKRMIDLLRCITQGTIRMQEYVKQKDKNISITSPHLILAYM